MNPIQAHTRGLALIALGALLSITSSACSAPEPGGLPEAENADEMKRLLAERNAADRMVFPDPSGPHSIGVVDFELVDNNREESFNPGQPRRIPVRAWFPASSVSGEPRLYATEQEIEHVIKGFSRIMPQSNELIESRTNVPTHAYENATPLDAGPLPTVIFSHGGFGFLQSNTTLMEHLASHGYLVLSITHPYLSSGTIHENGDIIHADQALLDGMISSIADPDSGYMDAYISDDPAVRLEAQLRNNETFALAPHFLIWQQDFMHVIDRLEAGELPEKAGGLLPLVDMGRIGTFGMSFGSSGSATALKDHRIKATVNLDGGVFDSTLYDTDIGVPVLVFHGDRKLSVPGQGPMAPHSEFVYEGLATMGTREDIVRIETIGSTHKAHTDAALTPKSVRAADPAAHASLGSIDGSRMVQIMNEFVRRWFDLHLSAKGDGLNEAFRAGFPEVVDVDLGYVREYAASNPEPGFMSYTHVFMMNRLLAADTATQAAVAALDCRYVMAFELTNGPRGGTQWWLVSFDPTEGLSFSLEAPVSTPDLTYTGDYTQYIRFMKRLAAGAANEAQQPVVASGDEGINEIIAEAFAAGRKAAQIKSVFPDV